MQRVHGAGLAALLALAPAFARAQGSGEILDEEAHHPPPVVSTDLLDPAGHSRFHLTTRATFADSEGVFSDSAAWSFEALVHVRIREGLALGAGFPFGLRVVPGVENQFYFGNFKLGVAGGASIALGAEQQGLTRRPRLRIGGAAEVYAPTAPEPEEGDVALALAQVSVAGIRSLEPMAYLSNIMAFRARAHADVQVHFINAALELGLVPAFTLDSSSDFLMWFSVAARISATPIHAVEPYVEMGSAIQVAGPDGLDLSPPFQLTPGVRFHIFSSFDPAVFVTFNFKEGKAILFGIDIAGVLRPSRRGREDVDGFLGGFE